MDSFIIKFKSIALFIINLIISLATLEFAIALVIVIIITTITITALVDSTPFILNQLYFLPFCFEIKNIINCI